MKKDLKSIALLIFAAGFLSACSPLKVNFSSGTPQTIDEVALVSTYLRIQLPVTPLIDAAIMNEKTNSMSHEINLLFEENIDGMRETAATMLKNRLRCNVIYGEALHALPGFKEFKEANSAVGALSTGKDHFPEITYAKDDVNPFEFENGRIEKYFQDPDNYMYIVSKMCEALNVDYIAVAETVLAPIPGSLVLPARLYTYAYFYLFDRKGTCLASGRNVYNPGVSYKATDIEGFVQALDNSAGALSPIVDKVAVKYGN
jgi:hypothetical protein